jgi:CheY-like chemotaxis protein
LIDATKTSARDGQISSPAIFGVRGSPSMSNDDTRSGARKILIVDDDADIRRALSRILKSEGHSVLQAEDGHSAVAQTLSHRPALLVLDYMMPGMDGEMVLDALRRELHEDAPPAVLMTACGFQQERAAEIGAVYGLQKPFSVPELLELVDHYLNDEHRKAS